MTGRGEGGPFGAYELIANRGKRCGHVILLRKPSMQVAEPLDTSCKDLLRDLFKDELQLIWKIIQKSGRGVADDIKGIEQNSGAPSREWRTRGRAPPQLAGWRMQGVATTGQPHRAYFLWLISSECAGGRD